MSDIICNISINARSSITAWFGAIGIFFIIQVIIWFKEKRIFFTVLACLCIGVSVCSGLTLTTTSSFLDISSIEGRQGESGTVFLLMAEDGAVYQVDGDCLTTEDGDDYDEESCALTDETYAEMKIYNYPEKGEQETVQEATLYNISRSSSDSAE